MPSDPVESGTRVPLLVMALVVALSASAVVAGAEPARPTASQPGATAPPGPGAERGATPPPVDLRRAAREVAATTADAPETAAAIRRTRPEPTDADAIEAVDVVGVEDGKPKRGDTQRLEGGQVITWIDENCYYASPPSSLDPGASTRLWVPTCKPGAWRTLGFGKEKRPSRASEAAGSAGTESRSEVPAAGPGRPAAAPEPQPVPAPGVAPPR
jgi:hypothetical protein